METNSAYKVVEEIRTLDALKIKGLGPAVANILYFLHPTLFPPFNTAIVNGFNLLFNGQLKLGPWEVYLEMREKLLFENQQYRNHFSKDLGALAGLLFEIGSNRIIIEKNALDFLNKEKEKIEKDIFYLRI